MTYEQFCATANTDHARAMTPLRLAAAESEANSAVDCAEYAFSRRDLCVEYRAACKAKSAQVLEDFKALVGAMIALHGADYVSDE